jgi:hypothetical protein
MQIKEYMQEEQFLHNMARILGAMGQAYLPAKADESHTNMRWDSLKNRLEARNMPLPDGHAISISFHPHELHFHIACNQQEYMVATKGNSLDFVLNKIAQTLGQYGLEGASFRQHLDYPYPQWNAVNGWLMQPEKSGLSTFQQIRSEANRHLEEFLQADKQHSEVRIWPHNFDTGIECTYGNGLLQYAGYSPADGEVYQRPYYYNSFYRNGRKIKPLQFPKLPHTIWETQRWGGAILPADAFTSWDDFLNAAPAFLQQTTGLFLKQAGA